MLKNALKNSEFHILTPLQQKFLRYFSGLPIQEKFYWTGGTALSEVYLYKRFSQDIDLFSEEPISYSEVIRVVEEFQKQTEEVRHYTTERIHDRKLFVLTNGGELKIEFTTYEFPSIKRRKIWSVIPIAVDSLEDIAVNKVMSIMDRREPKDVFDLYSILQHRQYSLEQLLQWVKVKFGPTFDKRTLIVEIMGSVGALSKLEPLLLAEEHQRLDEIEKVQQFYQILSDEYLREKFY